MENDYVPVSRKNGMMMRVACVVPFVSLPPGEHLVAPTLSPSEPSFLPKCNTTEQLDLQHLTFCISARYEGKKDAMMQLNKKMSDCSMILTDHTSVSSSFASRG